MSKKGMKREEHSQSNALSQCVTNEKSGAKTKSSSNPAPQS